MAALSSLHNMHASPARSNEQTTLGSGGGGISVRVGHCKRVFAGTGGVMRASAARLLLRRAHFDAAPSLLPSCGPQQLTDAPRGRSVVSQNACAWGGLQPPPLSLPPTLPPFHLPGPAVLLPRDDSSTLSYVKGSTDAPLIHLTLGELLERQASNFGSSAAVVSTRESTRLTYTELRRLADDVAQGLIALGVQVRR